MVRPGRPKWSYQSKIMEMIRQVICHKFQMKTLGLIYWSSLGKFCGGGPPMNWMAVVCVITPRMPT